MKRKLLSAALILSLAASMVGCGGKEANEDGSKQTAATDTKSEGTASTDKEATTEEPVELTWYMFGDEPTGTPEVQAALDAYTLEKLNATVDLNFVSPGEFNQKMSVIINSGENYDLTFTASWTNNYQSNAEKGAYREIDSLLDKHAPELKAFIPEYLWDIAKVNGTTYGMPVFKDVAAARYLYFPVEMLEKYNLNADDMNTLDKLEPGLKAIKENEPNIIPMPLFKSGYEIYNGEFDMVINHFIPVGIKIGEGDKAINIIEHPFTESAMKTLRRYYEAGYINADAATLEERPKNGFAFNDGGFPYADSIWSQQLGFPVKSTIRGIPVVATGSGRGSMHAISSTSQNPGKALELLQLINLDEYARNLITYGIEGRDYTKLKENYIEVAPDAFSNYAFATGTFFDSLYVTSPDPEDKWDKIKAWIVDDSTPSPVVGFAFNQEPVVNELAAIKNVTDKYYPLLFTGTVDPETERPKLLAELKKAGIDRVIDEVNKQIDEWKAMNGK